MISGNQLSKELPFLIGMGGVASPILNRLALGDCPSLVKGCAVGERRIHVAWKQCMDSLEAQGVDFSTATTAYIHIVASRSMALSELDALREDVLQVAGSKLALYWGVGGDQEAEDKLAILLIVEAPKKTSELIQSKKLIQETSEYNNLPTASVNVVAPLAEEIVEKVKPIYDDESKEATPSSVELAEIADQLDIEDEDPVIEPVDHPHDVEVQIIIDPTLGQEEDIFIESEESVKVESESVKPVQQPVSEPSPVVSSSPPTSSVSAPTESGRRTLFDRQKAPVLHDEPKPIETSVPSSLAPEVSDAPKINETQEMFFADDFVKTSKTPKNPEQIELSFEGAPRGRFSGEDPFVIDGEDLDLPPSLRKKR